MWRYRPGSSEMGLVASLDEIWGDVDPSMILDDKKLDG